MVGRELDSEAGAKSRKYGRVKRSAIRDERIPNISVSTSQPASIRMMVFQFGFVDFSGLLCLSTGNVQNGKQKKILFWESHSLVLTRKGLQRCHRSAYCISTGSGHMNSEKFVHSFVRTVLCTLWNAMEMFSRISLCKVYRPPRARLSEILAQARSSEFLRFDKEDCFCD